MKTNLGFIMTLLFYYCNCNYQMNAQKPEAAQADAEFKRRLARKSYI